MKYTVIVALMLMVPAALLAAPKNSGTVIFPEAIMVNGAQVPAGDYRVEWQGTGPVVEATILEGKTALVTAPATLVSQKSTYDNAIETKQGENNSIVLEAIDWSNRSLRFDQGSTSSPSTAPEATGN